MGVMRAMGVMCLIIPTTHITPITRIYLLTLLFSVLHPRMRHSLTQIAFLQEILFKPAKLLVNQIIGLMEQANNDVGHDLVSENGDWLRLVVDANSPSLPPFYQTESFIK
ncbi:MAG: hypothetical protein ACYC7E_17545 [Armatimonadota bacterium]